MKASVRSVAHLAAFADDDLSWWCVSFAMQGILRGASHRPCAQSPGQTPTIFGRDLQTKERRRDLRVGAAHEFSNRPLVVQEGRAATYRSAMTEAIKWMPD